MQDVLCLILGGGRGPLLYPLTMARSVPAVPIAGSYRLIDVPISNCLNSGIRRIYVLTQYLSASLHRHIANAYKFDPFGRGSVEVLAAQQTNEAADWYQGTADAIRQNLRYVESDGAPYVLILSGDQLYRMDYGALVGAHHASRADVTVAAAPVGRDRASSYGILRTDAAGRIKALVEKPSDAARLDTLRTPAEWLKGWGAGPGAEYLANMGVYVFSRTVLLEMLRADESAHDLVTGILAPHLAQKRVQSYLFTGYWQDLGTIRAYFEAHLALATKPPFDFHAPEGTMYTRMRNLPPARLLGAEATDCLLSDGCVVGQGTRLERCVLGLRSRIGRNVVVKDAVVLGADRFETDAEREANRAAGLPDFTIGDGTLIERAILDKDCRIGRNVRLVNRTGVRHADGENYAIREGIIVIPSGAVIPDGAEI